MKVNTKDISEIDRMVRDVYVSNKNGGDGFISEKGFQTIYGGSINESRNWYVVCFFGVYGKGYQLKRGPYASKEAADEKAVVLNIKLRERMIPPLNIKCPACGERVSHYLFYRDGEEVARCDHCGAIIGNVRDRSGILRHVNINKLIDLGEDADIAPFDFTYDNGKNRVHGFFNPETKSVVQFG